MLEKVKICHISTVHPTFDPRIFYKECQALAAAGYEVNLVIRHEKDTTQDGVNIVALSAPASRSGRFFLGFKALFKALKTHSRLFHFHDPELMPVGLVLKLLGKKVIYDVHEDVPKQIRDKTWLGPPFVRMIIAVVTHYFEQFCVFFFDGVVAATEDIGNKFTPRKTEVVRNFSILKLMDEVKPAELNTDKIIVMYAGGLTEIRGIGKVVDAMQLTDGRSELWLFGPWESSDFEEKCRSSEGWARCKYFGTVTMEEVFSYLRLADIGIHLVYPLQRFSVGLPTKAFEYMAYSMSMILTDFDYWQEVFGDASLYADPMSPEDIAAKIDQLANDEALRHELGRMGRTLAEQEYSWENESEKLLAFYRKIINGEAET